jgi:hypothetical protein
LVATDVAVPLEAGSVPSVVYFKVVPVALDMVKSNAALKSPPATSKEGAAGFSVYVTVTCCNFIPVVQVKAKDNVPDALPVYSDVWIVEEALDPLVVVKFELPTDTARLAELAPAELHLTETPVIVPEMPYVEIVSAVIIFLAEPI